MIEMISVKIASWIIRNDSGSSDKYDELVYTLQCLIERTISYTACIVIALLIGMLPQMLIWLVFYTLLRFHIGGLHAKTFVGCLIIGTAYSIICVIVVPYISDFTVIMLFELVFSILVTFLTKPVVHPNKFLSKENRIKKHKHGKILVLIEAAVVLLFYFVLKTTWLAQSAAIGMFAASLVCFLGKIFHNKM